MSKKIVIDPDKFTAGPMSELNRFIEAIIEEKKPYLITAEYIKKECDSVYLKVNNEVKKCNINRCLFVPGQTDPGQLVQVDSRNLY